MVVGQIENHCLPRFFSVERVLVSVIFSVWLFISGDDELSCILIRMLKNDFWVMTFGSLIVVVESIIMSSFLIYTNSGNRQSIGRPSNAFSLHKIPFQGI